MLRPTVRPHLDPLAHRAAIDALHAQRAAYQRYARTIEAQQRQSFGGATGGDSAVLAVDEAVRGFAELEDGAERVRAALAPVAEGGSPEQVAEVQRQMAELMREARVAEAAIQTMTVQLEAWRDAYGRQLAELGVQAGGDTTAAVDPGGAAPPTGRGAFGSYGPPARVRTRAGVPSVIDRKG